MRGNYTRIACISVVITIAIMIVLAFLPKNVDYLVRGKDAPVVIEDPTRQEMQNSILQMKEAIRKQRALLEELSCKSHDIGARGGFCLTSSNMNVGFNYFWDLNMSIAMENTVLKGASVGDFGAGLGWYGRLWARETRAGILYNSTALEKGAFLDNKEVQEAIKKPKMIREWEGFDGAGNVETLTGGFIKFLDLSEPQTLPRKYDWVVSIEVGEHIPAEYEEIFINNLDAHACHGIVLSWAIIGQPGHFHVNCRNNDYIKKKFAKRGFTNDLETEKYLRETAIPGNFRNTLMVFKRNVVKIEKGCQDLKK